MSAPFSITDVTIVTGDAAGTVVPGQTVSIDADGRIAAVGPAAGAEVHAGQRTIDGTGKFLTPGLINAHAHLFSDGRPLPKIFLNESVEGLVAAFGHSPIGHRWMKGRTKTNVITQLNSGVTTIRSLGDVRYEVVEVANEIDAGKYLGPRIIASGPLLAVSGGHGAPLIALISDNPWDARKNVRLNLREGVKAIKISATGGVTDAKVVGEAGRPQMTEDEMRAICEEAHNAGVLVAAHAQSAEGIASSLRAGVDTIEHGAAMTDEIVELYLDNPNSLYGTSSMIPTLQACLPLVKLDPKVTGIDEVAYENAKLVLDEMLQGIADALEHGVTLGFGTDSALTHVTHYNSWREMDYVVRYGGLTPAAALHAATAVNARILGLQDEIGSIEVGKQADLVLLDENPLESFRTYGSPYKVVIGGRVVENPAFKRFDDLDAKLDSF